MPSNRSAIPFGLSLLTLLSTGAVCATELKPQTAKAFQHYEEVTEARIRSEVANPDTFLFLDTLPKGAKEKEKARVRNGQIYIQQMVTKDEGKKIEIHDALIHHWLAVEFIPNARLEHVLQVVQDYGHYGDVFKPDVQRCEVLSQDGERYRVRYRFYKHTIVTVSYNAEFAIDFSDDPGRMCSFSHAVRIAEIREAGEKDEREFPVGNDHGYLWRLNFYTRYLEMDGGVYVQVEMLSLSRTVPVLIAWLVNPYLKSIPREYLTDYLRRLQKAVTGVLPAVPDTAGP